MKPLPILAAAAAMLLPTAVCAQAEGTSRSWVVTQTGHPIVEGSGKYVRQARSAAAFDEIESTGATRIEVVVGGAPGIEVEADDNLLGHVVTKVERGRLRVYEEGSFRTSRAPVVRISLGKLNGVSLKGSGDADIRGLHGGEVALASHGSGGFLVSSGSVDQVRLALSGSGRTDLSRLKAERVNVVLSGSGTARVRAERAIEAVLSGSGEILYGGPAREVDVITHGTGKIRRTDM